MLLNVTGCLRPWGLSSVANASFFSKKADPANKDAESAASELTALSQLNIAVANEAEIIRNLKQFEDEFKSGYREIETLINSNNTQQALSEATKVLNSVRVKIGIDIKAKITESIFVNGKFPEAATTLGALPTNQQTAIIKLLRDFRGGVFIDILNLSKRTALLYARAFQAELERSGGVDQNDRDKIIKDLERAVISPIYLVDRNQTRIVVFLDEVVNEDYTYLFNRELVKYLESNEKLQIKKVDFVNYVARLKTSVTPARKQIKDDFAVEQAELCFSSAETHTHAASRRDVFLACFAKFYTAVGSFDSCKSLIPLMADYDLYSFTIHRNDQMSACITYYKQSK